MNGIPVGRLASSVRGEISFIYDDSWLSDENRRAISLSIPLSTRNYSGLVVENFFDNLLPDSQTTRNRLQARTGADFARPFDLLSQIGRDCVGALQLLPEGEESRVMTTTCVPLTDQEIADILSDCEAIPLGVNPESGFRLSVAGVQEKTAFLLKDGRWCRPSGATPTSHIFKLPIGRLGQNEIDLSDSVENEWLCRQLLDGFGLPVAKTEVLRFGSRKVLAVERFDRRWSADGSWLMRLPQEDMCQATGTPGSLKYEVDGGPGMKSIMELLLGAEQSHKDRTLFMTAQVVFWMLGAIDGHAKNFSIFHLRGGLFKMTPLYDVISIYPVISTGQLPVQRVSMAMAVIGKNRHYRWNQIVRRHWLETATKCQFPPEEMDKIIDRCCDTAEYSIEKAKAIVPPGFPSRTAEAIFSGILSARDRLV